MSSIGPLSAIYTAGYDAPPDARRAPVVTYRIAATARTGSTLLAMDLWRLGLGAPFEYLNRPYMADLIARLNAPPGLPYWRAVEWHRTGANGVFGYKAFYPHYGLWPEGGRALRAATEPAHTIFLRRRHQVAQAVSLARAVQTRAWVKGAPEARAPSYDFSLIAQCHADIAEQEASWQAEFEAKALSPLEVFYEDYLEDPAGVCRQIAEFLQVDVDWTRLEAPLPKEARLETQSDRLNQEWTLRYQADRSLPPEAIAE